jgi:hypothetical protein
VTRFVLQRNATACARVLVDVGRPNVLEIAERFELASIKYCNMLMKADVITAERGG